MSFPALAPIFQAIGSIGTGLQAALSIGTTALGFAAEQQATSANNAAIEAANKTAQKQAISDYDQMTKRGKQETAAAAQKNFETSISTKKAVAVAKASASEGNVGGLSVESLLSDIYGQEARIRDGVNQNLEATQDELRNNKRSIGMNLKNTIASRPKSSGPSLIGAGLSAATGVVGAFQDDLRTRARIGDRP